MAVSVSRYAINTTHFHNITGTTHLFKQPFGAKLGIGSLVIGRDIGTFSGYSLIDSHNDTLCNRCFKDCI